MRSEKYWMERAVGDCRETGGAGRHDLLPAFDILPERDPGAGAPNLSVLQVRESSIALKGHASRNAS
jgi:hypothetical protein